MLRSMLLVGLLLAVPASAQQRIDPASWFSAADLPPSIQASVGKGGKMVMAIDVGADGRPVQCGIAVSSGLSDLDDLSCKLAMRRARWTPKQDAAGQASAAAYRVSVDWRQVVAPAPQWMLTPRAQRLLTDVQTYDRIDLADAGTIALDVVLTRDGVATRCAARPGGSSGSPSFDALLCRRVLLTKPFALAASSDGTAGQLGAVVSVSWRADAAGTVFMGAIDARPL